MTAPAAGAAALDRLPVPEASLQLYSLQGAANLPAELTIQTLVRLQVKQAAHSVHAERSDCKERTLASALIRTCAAIGAADVPMDLM